MAKVKVKFEIRLSGEIEVEARDGDHAIVLLDESDAYPLLESYVKDTKISYEVDAPL